MVAGVLFLFRKIYGEVVGALPLNGGAYNALLNTTSKSVASVAACLTLMSYMSTAVISANEAIHYAARLWENIPIIQVTIALLALFMLLTIIGITESAIVATVIFLFHLASLALLSGVALSYIWQNGLDVFWQNNAQPTPQGSIGKALFFGFSAAMLGISGFESSANFVEEQADGVFRKTLRNMWLVVSVFNPLMAFLVLAVIPMGDVAGHKEALLALMGERTGGHWLDMLISVDALLVLSGAVLTSFVGVGGLMERMTLDRILPQYLLLRNKRNAPYRIAIVFFLLCTSVLLITRGELAALAGVYTISFLLVMALFAIGNILLKVKRDRLPRPERAGGMAILVALVAVGAGAVGNAILNPSYLGVFFQYLAPTLLVIVVMLNRILILRTLLSLIHYVFDPLRRMVLQTNRGIQQLIEDINSQEFVFFTKGDNVASLNKVMQYISENEQTQKLKIVMVISEGQVVPEQLVSDLAVLDRAYPELHIEFIQMTGRFGPELIQELSLAWKIPVNFMFIGSPSDRFPYRIEQLGGVRLII